MLQLVGHLLEIDGGCVVNLIHGDEHAGGSVVAGEQRGDSVAQRCRLVRLVMLLLTLGGDTGEAHTDLGARRSSTGAVDAHRTVNEAIDEP